MKELNAPSVKSTLPVTFLLAYQRYEMNRKLSILGNEPRYPNGQPPYNTITELELEAVSAVVRRGELSGFVASPTESFWGGSEVELSSLILRNFLKRAVT